MSTPYKVPVRDYFEWQTKVLDKDLGTPPVSPTKGDRYILPSGSTGAWSGHDTEIAEYNGSSWDFIVPFTFFTAWVEDEEEMYYWNNISWSRVLQKSEEYQRRYALLVGGGM